MVGFVPEPPPNVLAFTFKFVGIGAAMQTFRAWFSSHLWCCLEERQKNYRGYICVIHVFVRGQLGSWVAGWIVCSFSQVLGIWRWQGYSADWTRMWSKGTRGPAAISVCHLPSVHAEVGQCAPSLLLQSRWTGQRLQFSHSLTLPAALLQQDVVISKDGPAGNSYLRPPGERRKREKRRDSESSCLSQCVRGSWGGAQLPPAVILTLRAVLVTTP